MGPSDLLHALAGIPIPSHRDLLCGYANQEDAAVFRLTRDLAVVTTVDFFTPIVDDPETYGAIAAANALSDVYAMGAIPRLALNVVGFPVDRLAPRILNRILRGGAAKAAEAGIPIAGGHTVRDGELKYGLAVIGTVHPKRFVTNGGARTGDVLFLTKPLGTGIIATAARSARRGRAAREAAACLGTAIDSMLALNRTASALMMRHGAHAATDVTGFGLLGHAHALARSSRVALEFDASAVPLLPGAAAFAQDDLFPGGSRANLEAVADALEEPRPLDAAHRLLLADAQTSGGLLIAMPADRADAFERALSRAAAREPAIVPARIGRVVAGKAGKIRLV